MIAHGRPPRCLCVLTFRRAFLRAIWQATATGHLEICSVGSFLDYVSVCGANRVRALPPFLTA